MYTVVKQFIRRLSVASALFITLIISSVARAHQPCGQEELVRCAQPLQVLTDSGLTFVASKKDLEVICPDLYAGLKCVHSYTRRCMSLPQRSHFVKLFHGTNIMVKELCSNVTYQDEYLKYAPCMRKVVHENELCFKKHQQTMNRLEQPPPVEKPQNNSISREDVDNGVRSVCCSFMEYIDCSTHTMRRTCGEDAAQFSKDFLDKMSSSMFKMHCREFMHDHSALKCPYYSSAQQYLSSFATILSVTLLSVFVTILR